MTKHKTEDYKISAVKYYLNNDRGDGGEYYGKTGQVSLFPKDDGTRLVNVTFN